MGKTPCCERNGLKKGPWTAEEDEKLIDYIQKHGHGRWRTLPKNAGLKRCGKSCRLRWTNYLRPDIKRGRFSFEEEEAIIQLHCILGNKWSAIAARLPGRTDNEIKNYWNTHIRKRLLRMGVDPVTHIPRLDLLEFSSILSSSLYNSSQFNIAAGNMLGIQQPIMANPNLLNLGTALLSYQHQNPEFIPQNHSKNQLSVPPFESQFQSFPIDNQEVLLNESQLTQANLDHFSAAPSYFTRCPNSLQNNGEPSNMVESFIPLPNNYDYNESDQSFINPLCETKPFQSNNCINNIQNSGFGSVLSTPSSSSTPLNSSSTIYANGSTEDERDSYCSNMLMFDFPNNMGLQESKLNEYRMCSNMLMFENQTL